MRTGLARAASASPASRSRCGSPTTCSWPTARAPSWACRRTTSATSSSRTRTACRSRRWCASQTGAYDDRARALAARPTPTTASRVNSGEFDGLEFQRGGRRDRRGARAEGPGPRSACSGACATGASRASATGAARSRSSTARAAAMVPVPDEQLPVVLPEDLVPDGSGNPLAQDAGVLRRARARSAASRRGARPTPWTPSSTRPGTSCATPARTATQAMVDERVRLLDAGGPVHRRHRARDPAPAVLALLDAR